MNLTASFNVFDGAEFLQKAIDSIRPQVDRINVVYQKISNYGESITKEDLNEIKSLEGADKLILFRPQQYRNGAFSEITKRNIGLNDAKKHGSTHFISLDCDEFFEAGDFSYVKKVTEEEGLDGSACRIKRYFVKPIWREVNFDATYMPLIYKIHPSKEFQHGESFPVLADPTRIMVAEKVKVFSNSVYMHHFSYVRKDLMKKLRNSSAQEIFRDKETLKRRVLSMSPGKDSFFLDEKNKIELEEVPNVFKLFEEDE